MYNTIGSTRTQEQRFYRLCQELELNDPQRVMVSSDCIGFMHLTYPKGYGSHLGYALQHNTHVKSLDLNLSYIILKQDNVADDDDDDKESDTTTTTTMDGCDLFLEFVKKSKTLREIKLCDFDNSGFRWTSVGRWTKLGSPAKLYTSLIDKLLQSIAMSVSITTLVFRSDIKMPLEALAHCIRRTVSLQKLDMALSHIVGVPPWSSELMETFGRSFSENTTIVSLRFSDITIDTVSLCTCVLKHLQNHPSLQELSLHASLCKDLGPTARNLHDSLSTVLRDTERLRELELKSFSFDSTFMATMIQAMRSNASLTDLCLWFCTLDTEATNLFVEFVQHLGMAANKCAVRSIKLTNTALTKGTSTKEGKVSATMLLGSKVTSARFLRSGGDDYDCFMEGFCSVIMDRASQVYVQSLQVPQMDSTGWAALAECIPAFVHLKELLLPPFAHSLDSANKCCTAFVRSLRRNGSLHRVKIYKEDSTLDCYRDLDGTEFWEWDEKFITAYCERNQYLSQQPQQMILLSDTMRSSGICAQSLYSGMLLLPSLFRCAQDMPRMGPQNILIGLLSAADHLGPYLMNATDSHSDLSCDKSGLAESRCEKRKKARKF